LFLFLYLEYDQLGPTFAIVYLNQMSGLNKQQFIRF